VDDFDASLNAVVDAFSHFQKRQEDEFLRPDYEYAITEGVINVPRIFPFTFTEGTHSVSTSEDRVVLVGKKPGRSTSLRWESRAAKELAGNEIEVEVFAAGLCIKVSDRISPVRHRLGVSGLC